MLEGELDASAVVGHLCIWDDPRGGEQALASMAMGWLSQGMRQVVCMEGHLQG